MTPPCLKAAKREADIDFHVVFAGASGATTDPGEDLENRDSYCGGSAETLETGDREHDVGSVRDQEPDNNPPRRPHRPLETAADSEHFSD